MATWAGLADAMDSARGESTETMDASDCWGVVVSSMRFFRIDFAGFEEEAIADDQTNAYVDGDQICLEASFR